VYKRHTRVKMDALFRTVCNAQFRGWLIPPTAAAAAARTRSLILTFAFRLRQIPFRAALSYYFVCRHFANKLGNI